jgi:hypothetical protein
MLSTALSSSDYVTRLLFLDWLQTDLIGIVLTFPSQEMEDHTAMTRLSSFM